MTVSTFNLPDYTQDNATQYKNNLDAGFAVLKRIAQAGAPHEEDPASDKIKVDAIERYDGGTIKSQSQQTTGSISFPGSNDRIDRVVLDESDLSVSVVTGTEASSPSAPAIPDGKLPCAQIRLSPSDTEITNDQITDERKAFLFYAVDSASTTDAQNVTQTYKGNDIADEDGIVYEAADSNQYDGVDPSDGTDGQVYTTDGTNGSFSDVKLDSSTGTSSGNYNSHEVTQTISASSTETVNVDTNEATGYVEGNASIVNIRDNSGNISDDAGFGDSGDDSGVVPVGTTTNGNGNLDGLTINTQSIKVDLQVTVRFSGIVE